MNDIVFYCESIGLGKHIWTYVGLAAPLLGAPGPLRSVLSGENMGLPFTDEEARILELCKLNLPHLMSVLPLKSVIDY